MIRYLLIALAIIIVAYVFYRLYFLQKPKSPHSQKPHFTLKIESD